MRNLAMVICFVLIAAICGTLRAGPTTAPATHPATAPTTQVSSDAEKQIQALVLAYSKLKSIHTSGKLTGEFDSLGLQDRYQRDFESRWMLPNLLSHKIPGEMELNVSDNHVYQLELPYKQLAASEIPEQWKSKRGLPDSLQQTLMLQDPAVLLAAAENPRDAILRGWKRVSASGSDLTFENDKARLTLHLLPQSSFIRSAEMDFSPELISRGATQVKKAMVTIDYATHDDNGAMDASQFAWNPPPGTREASAVSATHGMGGSTHASVGKPAPAFTLKDLGDKDVSLEALKGNVVVLDFWATWCGPCRMSLPGLNKLHKEMKDKPVRVFAVNQREPKEKVVEFRDEQKFEFSILLDLEGAVGESYGVSGIPHTVVIDKSGTIVDVIIGFGGAETEKQLRESVEKAIGN